MMEEIPISKNEDLQELFRECKIINSKLQKSIADLINCSRDIYREDLLSSFEELNPSEKERLKALYNDCDSCKTK